MHTPVSRQICRLQVLALTILLSLSASAQGQIRVQQLDLSKLPSGVRYEGKVKNAVRWTDKLGDNIVITTETGAYQSDKFEHESDGSDAELFAYHFLVKKDGAVQTWKVYDFISDCMVDMEVSYVKNTFQVTDLDQDGVGEIWLMYKMACRGDVSPADMKIIMYEGAQKYAIRGQNKVRYDETHFAGGEYKYDEAFAAGPKAFLEFADKLWNKHIMEKWESE